MTAAAPGNAHIIRHTICRIVINTTLSKHCGFVTRRWAFGIILCFSVLLTLGTKESSAFNLWTTVLHMALIVFIIIAGFTQVCCIVVQHCIPKRAAHWYSMYCFKHLPVHSHTRNKGFRGCACCQSVRVSVCTTRTVNSYSDDDHGWRWQTNMLCTTWMNLGCNRHFATMLSIGIQ